MCCDFIRYCPGNLGTRTQNIAMLEGLNHITLSVSDLDTSLTFYREVLGCKGHVKWQNGAYLSVGQLWLCLSQGMANPATDYSHIAFSVCKDNFDRLKRHLLKCGIQQWQVNSSEGDSIYLLDPDGHKLEVHVGSLASRLESLKTKPYKGLEWLED